MVIRASGILSPALGIQSFFYEFQHLRVGDLDHIDMETSR